MSAINKVVFGGNTLIDLTDLTVDQDKLLRGYTARRADGNKVTGTVDQTVEYLQVGGTVSLDEDDYLEFDDSGGSVTITDEANATGTTCVITTGAEPSPTPSEDIPLNTQLIDFAKVSNDTGINDNGQIVSDQWYSLSDYTEIDPSMTFTAIGARWNNLGFYGENFSIVRVTNIDDIDGTTISSNYKEFTLNSSNIPSNAKYVRLPSTNNPSSSILSLIRTA